MDDDGLANFLEVYAETWNENPVSMQNVETSTVNIRMDYELQRRVLTSPVQSNTQESFTINSFSKSLSPQAVASHECYTSSDQSPTKLSWGFSSMNRTEFLQVIEMLCNSTIHRQEFIDSGGLESLIQLLPTLEESVSSKPSSIEDDKRKELTSYAILMLLSSIEQFHIKIIAIDRLITNRLVQAYLGGNRNQRKNAELSLQTIYGSQKMALVFKYIQPITIKSKILTNILYHGEAILKILSGKKQSAELSSPKPKVASPQPLMSPNERAVKINNSKKQLHIDVPSPSSVPVNFPFKSNSAAAIPVRKASMAGSEEDLISYWQLEIPSKFPRPTPPLTPSAGLKPVLSSPALQNIKSKAQWKRNLILAENTVTSNSQSDIKNTSSGELAASNSNAASVVVASSTELKEESRYDVLLQAAKDLRIQLDRALYQRSTSRIVWNLEQLQQIALCVYSIWCLLLREPEIIAADMHNTNKQVADTEEERDLREEELRSLRNMPKSLRNSLMSFMRQTSLSPIDGNKLRTLRLQTLRPFLLDEANIIPKLLQLLESVDEHMAAREAMDDIISVYSAPSSVLSVRNTVATSVVSTTSRNLSTIGSSALKRKQSSHWQMTTPSTPLASSSQTLKSKGILKTSTPSSTPKSLRNATFADGTKPSDADPSEEKYISQYSQHLARLRQSITGCMWCLLSGTSPATVTDVTVELGSQQTSPLVSHWVVPYRRSLHQRLAIKERSLSVGEMVVVYSRVHQVLIIRSLDILYCYDVEGIFNALQTRQARNSPQLISEFPLRFVSSREEWLEVCCQVIEENFGVTVTPLQGHWVQAEDIDCGCRPCNVATNHGQLPPIKEGSLRTMYNDEEEEEHVHVYQDGEDIGHHRNSYYFHRDKQLQPSDLQHMPGPLAESVQLQDDRPSFAAKISFDEDDKFALNSLSAYKSPEGSDYFSA